MNIKTKEEILAEKSHDFESLISIMTHLRGENGCPWDKEQSHDSIRNCLIEETYEVIEAIDKNDTRLLCEELGDLIFQTVFHAEIEREKDNFNIYQVLNGICNKMIRRHPHVFSNSNVDNSQAVSATWEEIKSLEKSSTDEKKLFMTAPAHLPALVKAEKFHTKAQTKNRTFFTNKEEAVQFAIDHISDPAEAVFALAAASQLDGIDLESALNEVVDKYNKQYSN